MKTLLQVATSLKSHFLPFRPVLFEIRIMLISEPNKVEPYLKRETKDSIHSVSFKKVCGVALLKEHVGNKRGLTAKER